MAVPGDPGVYTWINAMFRWFPVKLVKAGQVGSIRIIHLLILRVIPYRTTTEVEYITVTVAPRIRTTLFRGTRMVSMSMEALLPLTAIPSRGILTMAFTFNTLPTLLKSPTIPSPGMENRFDCLFQHFPVKVPVTPFLPILITR